MDEATEVIKNTKQMAPVYVISGPGPWTILISMVYVNIYNFTASLETLSKIATACIAFLTDHAVSIY